MKSGHNLVTAAAADTERAGFEPAIRLPVRQISSLPPDIATGARGCAQTSSCATGADRLSAGSATGNRGRGHNLVTSSTCGGAR